MNRGWAMVAAMLSGCASEEGACVWTGGTCYETSLASCDEDDEVQGGSTFHEGETCVSLGCDPVSDDKNEPWHQCETN